MSESVKSDQHEPYWIRRVRRSDFYSKCILPYPRLCWLFIESHGTIPTVIRLRVYRLRGLQTKLQISMCGLGFNPSDAQWPELSPLTDLCRDACWWRLKWNRLESRGWPCLPLQPAKKLSLVNARAQRLSVPFGYLLMILATTVYSTTSLRRPSYLKDGLKVDEASPCMTSTYKCNISVLWRISQFPWRRRCRIFLS